MGNVIDSPEIIQAKRRIMLNEPHKEHFSHLVLPGDEYEDCLFSVPTMKNTIIALSPKVYGSGTPSVNNKRGIGGWYSIGFAIGDTSYNISLSDAGRGGTMDPRYEYDTGVLTSDLTSQTLNENSSITSYTTSGSSSIFWFYAGNISIYNNPQKPLFSNMFTFTGYHYNYGTVPDWSFAGSSSYPNSFWVKIPTSELSESSLAGAKAWVAQNNVQIVGPRKSGTLTVNIGSTPIKGIRGLQSVGNAIDCGSMLIEYDYWTN